MIRWAGLALLIFVSAAIYDLANSNYIRANTDNQPVRAAVWSAITAGMGLVGLLGILEVSPWLAVPEVAGFSAGTYLAVWLRTRRAPKGPKDFPTARIR